jgi:hypothetical protein
MTTHQYQSDRGAVLGGVVGDFSSVIGYPQTRSIRMMAAAAIPQPLTTTAARW